MRIMAAYMARQFVILPGIGFVRDGGDYYCRLIAIWGFWGISIGLGKLLR